MPQDMLEKGREAGGLAAEQQPALGRFFPPRSFESTTKLPRSSPYQRRRLEAARR